MSDLRTGWETSTSDDWSTLGQEAAYLQALQAEAGFRLTTAGHSIMGNAVWRVDIGAESGPTLLIGGAVHGRELSGREAALIWLRELSESTDPAIINYLQTHRIVIVPNISPDASGQFTRFNVNGAELNRDYIQLTQPETRIIRSVMKDADPQIIVDLHEVDISLDGGADWRPYPGGIPGTHPDLQAASQALLDEAITDMTTAGYTTLEYPNTLIPWGGGHTISGAFHALGLLSEPSMRLPRYDRVQVMLTMFRTVMAWHAAHQSEIVAAITASKASVTNGGVLSLPTGHRIHEVTTVPDPGEYVPGWEVPQRLLDAHGIVMTDGVISTAQEARLIVAALFDPASFYHITEDPWWVAPDTPPASGGPALRVKQDGLIRTVRETWLKSGGQRRRVTEAWVKQDGVRRRV